MEDEIKLKDMTDFLENVYKDIKKQPTLEEELEKERKFINKIKGDNEDEIKEILEKPNVYNFYDECYLYFGDYNKLKDYITNLQKIIKQRDKDIDTLLKTIKVDNSKIDKAIEYIIKNSEMYDEDLCTDVNFELVDLLNILGGDDNE